jgi:hypothetical protein
MIYLLTNSFIEELSREGGILHLSGHAGSGKTLFASVIASFISRTHRVEWISTDGKDGFLRFLNKNIQYYGGIASNISITQAYGKESVLESVLSLKDRISNSSGLIIIDPLSKVLDMSRTDPLLWGRELFEVALPTLASISESHRIPIIITSEVRNLEGAPRAIFQRKILQWVRKDLRFERPYDIDRSKIREQKGEDLVDFGAMHLELSGHVTLTFDTLSMEVV